MRLMRFWPALGLTLLLCLSSGAALAQMSPFSRDAPERSASDRSFTGPGVSAPAEPAGAWARLQAQIREIQQNLYRRLANAVRRIKSEGYAAGGLLAGLSFVYGIFHAVGPGHGKAVISSYLVAEERTMRRGIALSFLASAAQAVSAIAIVGLLAILLNASGMQIRSASLWLERGSYLLVGLLGAWMTFSHLKALIASRQLAVAAAGAEHAYAHAPHVHSHSHSHAHGGVACGHAHMPDPSELQGAVSWRRMAALVLAIGLRPCSGAIIVLVFALANGLFLAGVGATFAMALGTAITVSALAVLAVGSKAFALKLASGDELWGERIYRAAALLGSLLLLALGVVLFAVSLGPARPF